MCHWKNVHWHKIVYKVITFLKFIKSNMDILGVRVDNLSKKEILEKVESFLSDGKFHQIATINPEFILQAQKDEDFKSILNTTALNIADGVGIRFAFLRFGKWLKARIAGADLMHEILHLANEKKLTVFLAANKNGLSRWEETCDALQKKYPDIEFSGANLDPLNFSSYQMPDTGYQILFCNFGAPFQEKFINFVKDAKIRVAMGVGGSFDFVTGKARRAPRGMRIFGLEWLWRLILQPRRWKRIWNAVIIFPIKIIFKK
jgi:N-acetylglucosaminyldiphosphoundecaprenol N-acetyl-beta-D-mannosaminyltransferase